MCESYNKQYKLNYTCLMPTNLYGPNDNYHLEDSHVIPGLIHQCYLAVKEKRKVKFATRTKITIMKNHVNGLGYEAGKILITPHGFIAGREASEEKKSIDNYKQENATFWSEQLGVGGDFDLKIEKEND